MFALIIILFSATLFLLCYVYCKWQQLQPYNQKPLDIKTFDGSNSPYHPSVLYFKDGWNGYKYWMAETPFSPQCKPYMDRNECPSIHVSNDGIKWKEIAQNPIDDLNETEVKELDFFSDPQLVFVNGKIECWYRFTHREGDAGYFDNIQLVRRSCIDGINWSNREVLVNLATNEGDSLGNMVVSPSIIYENGIYRMWYVNSESTTIRGISYSESIDGHNWKKAADCMLLGKENIPWHIDIKYINGKYLLINYDFKSLTAWSSKDGINFYYTKELLSPSITGSFYGYTLYRACVINDDKYKIYFSGNDSLQTHIGLMQGDDINSLSIVSDGANLNILQLLKHLYLLKRRSVLFIMRKYLKIGRTT